MRPFRRTALPALFSIGLSAALLLPAGPARAWEAVEKTETYGVSGSTGIELYRSIGENGPKVGTGRVIAYTDFKLTWRRDYQPQADGGCRIVTAVPRLIITYRLPKPRGKLPAQLKRLWDTFSAGVTVHEKVHGEMIVELVKQIEAVSLSLSSADDPDCNKLRAELQKRLAVLSQEQRRKSRDFDRDELSEGGNVHKLILALVNSG